MPRFADDRSWCRRCASREPPSRHFSLNIMQLYHALSITQSHLSSHCIQLLQLLPYTRGKSRNVSTSQRINYLPAAAPSGWWPTKFQACTPDVFCSAQSVIDQEAPLEKLQSSTTYRLDSLQLSEKHRSAKNSCPSDLSQIAVTLAVASYTRKQKTFVSPNPLK